MDFSVQLTGTELSKVKAQVDALNSSLNQGRGIKSELGKDDFLQILVTQLTHQDPTAPMEDRDFIAQMAQFSSLEQITNMSKEFTRLSGMIAKGQAISMIGRIVEVPDGEMTVRGRVEGVTGGDFPLVLVNGKYYDFAEVESVNE